MSFFVGLYTGLAIMFYLMTLMSYLDVVKKPWYIRYFVFCYFYWWKLMYDMIWGKPKEKKC